MNNTHILTALTAAALTACANAAVVITPSAITFTGTAAETYPDETRLTDGSGLSAVLTLANIGTVTHSSVSTNNAWVTTDPGTAGGDFFAQNGGTTVSFELTLDQTYNITDFVNWAYGFGTVNDNNISSVTFDYGVGNFSSSTGPIAIAEASAAGRSVITSVGGITADRIRINVTDNHYIASGGDGGDRVGLAEIRFIGTAIPEPSTSALIGLGALSLILRRRR